MKDFYNFIGSLIFIMTLNLDGFSQETVVFKSKDGLEITADLYQVENSKSTILLCHQAGYSRGEYINTAKELNVLGYSCMAIDQRSGNKVNSVINQTNTRAKAQGLPTNFLDARQDIEVAIDYLYKVNDNKQLIIVGSSYSAALVLLIGKENDKDKVKAVASFSPGEYLKGVDVTNAIANYNKKIFVTSSNKEAEGVTKLVHKIASGYVTQYVPSEKGIHGSRALWKTTEGSSGYWKSFKKFLKKQ